MLSQQVRNQKDVNRVYDTHTHTQAVSVPFPPNWAKRQTDSLTCEGHKVSRRYGNANIYRTGTENQRVHSLRGFDDVPRAVVVHVAFAARVLVVAVVVMTLGFDFLEGKREEKGGKKTLAAKTNKVLMIKKKGLQTFPEEMLFC